MTWNTHIPKFRRFVLQNFPFIEEDFDALTDYELICKVIEFLNRVITSQNEVVAEVERFETDVNDEIDTFETNITNNFNRLEGLFNDLKSFVDNYFDNLDVQQEINNKLEQMAEDGTLQEIITAYIQSNVAWTFDTVAEMKQASNLIDGSYAQTFGYNSVNDGGGAKYKIRTMTGEDIVDNMTIIAIDQTLIAELIFEPVMTTKQFGAGVNTDLDVLKKSIANCDNLILSSDMTITPQQIEISKDITIDFNGHKITMEDNDSVTFASLFRITGGNVVFKNGEIDGNSEGQTVTSVINNTGVTITSGTISLYSMKIYNCLYEGVITNGNCNLNIHDSKLYNCGRNDIAILSWNNVIIENCEFDGYLAGGENIANIDVEPYEAQSSFGNITINNCVFKGNKLHAISNYLDANQTASANILLSNCKFYNQLSIGYDRGRKSQYNIFNCIFESISDKPAIYLYETKENVNINNVTIKNCTTGIQCKLNHAWDVMKRVKINASFIGTITTAIEFALEAGVTFTADNPFFYFDINVTGSNNIKGWQNLHMSKIKTQSLISTDNIALDFNHFYSDIYMTGYGKHIEIDPIYYKSKNIGVPFTIHTDVSNAIWSQKLPVIDSNIGTYGTVAPGNGSSFSITIKNFNYDKFIIDNICGLHTPKDTQ